MGTVARKAAEALGGRLSPNGFGMSPMPCTPC